MVALASPRIPHHDQPLAIAWKNRVVQDDILMAVDKTQIVHSVVAAIGAWSTSNKEASGRIVLFNQVPNEILAHKVSDTLINY